MEQQPPPPHVSRKGMWVSKLLFRILSAISSVVIVGITAALTARWYDDYDYDYDYYAGYATPIAVLGPPTIIGFSWDVAEGISILARRGHRGIHPGAIVAIDLLLWLGFVVATVWFGLFPGFDVSYDSYYYDSSDIAWDLIVLSRVALAFGALEVVLHLTLFIFGCYETNIRNRAPPVIVYSGAPPMHPSMYGPQHIILPAGQQPPPGWVPYVYGGPQPQPQPQEQPAKLHEYYRPQESSPEHMVSSPSHSADWRNSHHVSQEPYPNGGQPQ